MIYISVTEYIKSLYERLKGNSVYRKNLNTTYGNLSISGLETDLDNMQRNEIDNPLYQYLRKLYRDKVLEGIYDKLVTMDVDTGNTATTVTNLLKLYNDPGNLPSLYSSWNFKEIDLTTDGAGSATDSSMTAPGAGKNWYIDKFHFSSDDGDMTQVVNINLESATSSNQFWYGSFDGDAGYSGQWIHVNRECPDANEAVLITLTGANTKNYYLTVLSGYK